MRDALRVAVRKSIVFKCALPHKESGVDKSCISAKNDLCFKNDTPQEIAKVIYNGIVEVAVNEYDIDYENLEKEQRRAIISRIRYKSDDDNSTKLKYGFYGEVLLDLILRTWLRTRVLAARGYFYSPLEDSEVKGFDAFHVMKSDNGIELWFGEAKFYQNYKRAISSVLEKLNLALSDGYMNKSLIAIINQREHLTERDPRVESLLDAWERNPEINLAIEMKLRDIPLVHPIFIAYEKKESDGYQESIKKCIDHIATEYSRLKITIPASFEYQLFFIFLPLSEIKSIKESVIKWIESKEPLM